jgi:hypothetical protein
MLLLVVCANPATSVPVYRPGRHRSVARARRCNRVAEAAGVATALDVLRASAPAPAPEASRIEGDRLAGRLHVVSLLVAGPLLFWLGRDMWFRLDEWRIVLGHTGAGSQPWDVFAPFDVHWSTAIVLIYRAVGALVGASSYLPYMAVAIAVHLLAAHLLWRVLLRCGADAWVATLCVAAFLVLGGGWEAMFWLLALSFSLPLALTLGALLLVDRDELRARHRGGIVVLTLVAVMSSGAGVAMLVVPAVVAIRRRGMVHGISAVAPAAAVYALWLALAGSGILDHPGGASATHAGDIARFVWDGMVRSMATLLGPTLLGATALVVLAAWMAVRAVRRDLPPAVLACAIGAVAVFLLTALGRANGDDASAPRYLFAGVGLLLPAVALVITDLARRVRMPRLLVMAGLGIAVAHSAALLVSNAATASAEDQHSRQLLLAAVAISRDGTTLPQSIPEPVLAWGVLGADVVRLRDAGDLQPPATIPTSTAEEIRLRLHVEVSDTAAPGATTSPQVTAARDATLSTTEGCTVANGSGDNGFTISVAYSGAGALHVTAITPVAVKVYLHGTLQSPTDEAARFLLPPQQSRWVDDTAPASTLILHVSAGTVRLCP